MNPFKEHPGGIFSSLPGLTQQEIARGRYFSQGLQIPGDKRNLEGGLTFGFPDQYPDLPKEAYLELPGNKPGQNIVFPKGFYTTKVRDNFGESKLGLPNLRDPFSMIQKMLSGIAGGGKSETEITGINIPIPGARPVSIQFRKEELSNLEKALKLGYHNPVRRSQTPPLFDSILDNLRGDREVVVQPLPDLLRDIAAVRPDRWADAIRYNMQNQDFLKGLATRLMQALRPALAATPKPQKPGFTLAELLDQKADSTSVFLGLPGLQPFYVGGFTDTETRE